jgi:alpha-L-fucosidase
MYPEYLLQICDLLKNSMIMRKKDSIVFLSGLMLLFACQSRTAQEQAGPDRPYEPTWESLAQHEAAPRWFRDAKFGIYFHWGVYAVPAFGNEWYPRHMHFEGRPEYAHHLKTYGHPSEFGYHDFVPMFKAEHFDAEQWADLFQRAGARFAGPVAEHHDGFSMWDSDVTPWNAMDKGPHRDITGELARAFRARDIKLITTFHHARNLQRHDSIPDREGGAVYRNSHYPFFTGMPPASDDPELKYLYGNLPEQMWLEEVWFGKLKEVVDQYQPDIIWFDSWLDQIPEEYRQEFCAYYLNKANEWNKEVVIVRKQDDLPLEVSVDDLEKSRKNKLDPKVWMTDETVSTGSWCYTSNLQIKPPADVLHVLIDIVSKNGVLLLNISPKADGTIPEEQQQVLLRMGEWLSKYGEAIYGTRPWITFGEGPTKEPEGHFRNAQQFLKVKYSAEDVRFTQKGEVLYATLLGWPGGGAQVVLDTFAPDNIGGDFDINAVGILGYNEAIQWEHKEDGLHIRFPQEPLDDMAVVLKLTTSGEAKLLKTTE